MISVVIPAYNNPESVRRLLVSIYKQLDESRGEVIVVDDGSKSCDMTGLEKEFKKLKVIRLKENKGAANARNVGAEHALYDTIVFFDSDMELCENTMDEFIRSMEDPKVDAVVGTVSDIPLNRGIFQDYWALLKSYFHSLPQDYSSTFYPMIGAIRKRVFEDAGGFDARIKRASVEDYELSMRLAGKGYKVRFNPAIKTRTTYKDMLSSLKQSIERSKKWGIMFLERRTFDNHTTTAAQGAANFLGLFFWIFCALSFAHISFAILALVSIGLVCFLIRGFLLYIIKRRGLIFAAISFLLYLISSIAITLGFLSGITYIFRDHKSRKEALYA